MHNSIEFLDKCVKISIVNIQIWCCLVVYHQVVKLVSQTPLLDVSQQTASIFVYFTKLFNHSLSHGKFFLYIFLKYFSFFKYIW